MNDFFFFNPVKIYFGENQIQNLPKEAKQFGKKILLVYGGQSIRSTGLYNIITDLLNEFTIVELGGVEPNPDVSIVRKGAEICKMESIELLIAVGGGSVIDASKWIAAAACSDYDAWDFFCKKSTVDDALPLITVPTMAATGSEMNHGGVISNKVELKKIGRSSPLLFPKASFLNPKFTYSVGKYQTVCGSVDIISHIIEVYFNNQQSLEMLDSIMESLIKTVIKNTVIAIDEPSNYEARANLMWAASWAINGFINGPVKQGWNCHTIEHELSARYGITHGHGLAIIIPRWIRYCYTEENKNVYMKFAKNVLEIDIPDNQLPDIICTELEKLFFCTFGLSSNLKDLNIPSEELPQIADAVCGDGIIHGFAELDNKDVLAILKMCY
ncbi:MAG: iron-containing alcohol dehydrogenase [Lachnospiraceae bacterium]|nr:iron-containing alcohol dehydrogenase [Lachnospiraceae bacterium]